MTGHYCDFKNADVILTSGSNNLENHPVSSKWVQRALDKGATWIVVDPRFTRTAAQADIYCPIRSGTDIAFYGGMINYIIENDLWQHEYVEHYTNATFIMEDGYEFDPETGLFSGWDDAKGAYDKHTWHYAVEQETEWDTSESGSYAWVKGKGVPKFTPPKVQVARKDPTMQNPMCVWQLMKKHYSRYTIDKVCEICGMDAETLEQVYAAYASTGAPEKSGTILYALGQTQHTYGTNNTRIMSLVQLILGNAGIAGGGLNALRGEPNVQGATDMAMLVFDFPGYLRWPNVSESPSLRKWCESQTYYGGYYTNKPKFMVSALKEWFGENATVDNDYCYDLLPKVPANGGDYTTMGTFHLMDSGVMKGYFAWGQNPVVSDPNSAFNRRAMSKLEWLVVADWVETATASFWRAPDMTPEDIQTEVYFLPAALIYEKMGTIANSGRWLQWRYKAADPVGEARPDYEIADMLWSKIVELYKAEGGPSAESITNVKWDYYIDGKIDPRAVAWGFNGYNVEGTDFASGKVDLLPAFASLKADGSTSCAIWIYGGYYNNADAPLDPAEQPVGRRGHDDPGELGLYPQWAFSWPANRRIIYNRASADANGKPWNPDRVLVEWDGKEWATRNDVPDFVFQTTNADGTTTPVAPNDNAFFMKPEQHANFISYGLADAALPEHYEPFETPMKENLLNARLNSPCVKFGDHESVKKGDVETYPIVATTYSITEHWQTGAQTRMCPALDEISPKQFIEMSPELAQEKGIGNGDDVRVFNNRGSVVLKALVTRRIVPLEVNGQTIHEVGMIHHWDWTNRYSSDDNVVNDLTPNVGDPNSFIPEFKAFLVDVEKA
ncbi:MAG: molybdopterin-dependent oxidoreductase [Eggerthellaceae bacterium]|nr:molybdopterin-dependent oxidoreductase [Eggerthellaceae bacterium]